MCTPSELNQSLQECAGLSVTGVGLGAGFPSHGGSSSSPLLMWKPNYDIVPTRALIDPSVFTIMEKAPIRAFPG